MCEVWAEQLSSDHFYGQDDRIHPLWPYSLANQCSKYATLSKHSQTDLQSSWKNAANSLQMNDVVTWQQVSSQKLRTLSSQNLSIAPLVDDSARTFFKAHRKATSLKGSLVLQNVWQRTDSECVSIGGRICPSCDDWQVSNPSKDWYWSRRHQAWFWHHSR